MRFTIFDNAKSQQGRLCTYDEYLTYACGDRVRRLCAAISHEEDHDKRSKLKQQLPVITWQAEFEGRRLNAEAKPSGLFMLDIDHVEIPTKLYNEKVAGHLNELGIVFAGVTASGHGLRIIAKCRKEYKTIDECQQWLSAELGVEHDPACKDWARCSYLVSEELTLYMNAKAIWQEDPEPGTVYNVNEPLSRNVAMERMLNDSKTDKKADENKEEVDQREGLFGGVTEYRGIPLEKIAKEWLEYTGGEPEEGERNIRLHRLVLRMRYICNFNEATLLKVIPRYGVGEGEMKTLIHSATSAPHGQTIPRDLEEVIQNLMKRAALKLDDDDDIPEQAITTSTAELPPLPPVIKEWCDIAPEDFKQAVILCQLPILGTLASRLRAKYLDGQLHSPTFQVSLEAPQASGKSFMMRLVNKELAQVIEHDEVQREKEREYDEKMREMKLLNIKITPENKDQVLGTKPKSLIRIVPPTISITKLLMRMNDAQGLHLFCFCPEADTMTKAFKRGFSSFSDLLRLSFDNEKAGQDYATDTSFSGTVRMYYNLLLSGTPKAMRRFYPDVEDGLISRVCFVTLPDQFGKPMPIWQDMTKEQVASMELGLVRLNDISIQGDEVQPEYVMKMEWLNKHLKKWILQQQSEAVRTGDRTRDIFCRRAAVVGFRAGMIAWYLYGQTPTPPVRKKVMKFAEYVANCMLNQHILRFNVQGTDSNVNRWENVYERLGDEFSRSEVQKACQDENVGTPLRMILYKWRLLGLIDEVKSGRAANGNKTTVQFKKIKK